MINKEFILNADGTIKKDFTDRNIPQNANNQVIVNVLIPSQCFTGLSNYAVILGVSRIISNQETTLNSLIMTASKSINIDGVLYVKYSAILSISYTDKLGTLKVSPYIQTTATTEIGGVSTEVISIQQAFTNSNLNVIKSVLPQYDASLEEGTIATTLETQINGKKIYTFIDSESASLGEHYYELATGYDPNASQFNGCLVVSVYNGQTSQYMPFLEDDEVKLLEINQNGYIYVISGVDYENSTYTYTKSQLTYLKSDIDSKVSDLNDAINLKANKSLEINGHSLTGDITLQPSDIQLGNVNNWGAESTPTASGSELYITSKGVYDALQDLNSTIQSALSGKADSTDITSLDSRLDAIESLIGDNDGDQDNIINTLKEVITALSGLGEDANILNLINSKVSQSDFDTLNSQINGTNGIATKVSFLYDSNANAYAEIKAQSGTIDILVADWDDNDDANYPYKWELSNGYLVGASYVSVVFDKDSDTSMLSATIGIDDTNGKLIIYASELPSATISIQMIAIFNSVNAYELYNQTLINQVATNTNAINEINNTKLPQYVKLSFEYEKSGETTNHKYETTQPNSSGISTLRIENNHTFYDGNNGLTDIARLFLKTNELHLFWSKKTDSNNNKSKKIKMDADGIELNCFKRVNGVETSHSLTFDANGDLKIDGVAVGGGGKQLYQHNIRVSGISSGTSFGINLKITNDNNTQFTLISLRTWLINNGFDGSITNMYECNGSTANPYYINGINGSNSGKVYLNYGIATSFQISASDWEASTIVDTPIPL